MDRGPIVGSSLVAVVHHDPHPECDLCGGSGDYPYRIGQPCPCCCPDQRPVEIEDVVLWLKGLDEVERARAIRALLPAAVGPTGS